MDIAERADGFTITGYRLELSGYCRGGMFTYNTMQTFIGVVGLQPLEMVSPPSDDPRLAPSRLCSPAGHDRVGKALNRSDDGAVSRNDRGAAAALWRRRAVLAQRHLLIAGSHDAPW